MVTYTKEEDFRCQKEEDVFNLGVYLASYFAKNITVLLKGTLGSGKTLLIRGMTHFFSVPAYQVSSPSFAIVHDYQGSCCIKHLDLYRLTTIEEWYHLGIEELLGKTLVFIEWPEIIESKIPLPIVEISITINSDQSRGVNVVWHLEKN